MPDGRKVTREEKINAMLLEAKSSEWYIEIPTKSFDGLFESKEKFIEGQITLKEFCDVAYASD